MKKEQLIAVCRNSTLLSVTISRSGTMIASGNMKFDSLSDMYKYCLKIASENGIKVGYKESFGAKWYDILFINTLDTTPRPNRYGLR